MALLVVGSMAASQYHKPAASHAKVPDGKRSLTQASDRQNKVKISESVGKLPLAFEPNQGQTDAQVKYIARAKGYTAFLTADEAMLRVKAGKGKDDGVLQMKLRNSNAAPRIVATDRQSGISNYFIGNDRSKWHTNVPNFGKVTYEEVYPGIDVVYSGNQRDLEYDLVVKPGSDPSRIRLAYEGSSRFDLDRAGDLELQTSAGTTVVHKPVVYQTIGGARHSVDASYVVMASNEVAFRIGAYDASQALVIDPVVTTLSFLGGSGNDSGAAIATQTTGAPTGVYLIGSATSINFVPTPKGFQTKNNGGVAGDDVVVVGLDPTGTKLAYSTYLGGSADDFGTGIAVDAAGNAYVTGYTQSLNYTAPAIGFPSAGSTVPAGAVIASFVAKLNAAGSALVYSTLVGGAGVTHSNAIALDPSGNAFIGGDTTGLSAPSTVSQNGVFGGGATDGFVGQVNPAGTVTFTAYLGGSAADAVNSVGTDSSGNVYVTGTTSSNASAAVPFPTSKGAVASTAGAGTLGFAAALPAALTGLTYSATFGGGGETANGLAVNATGTAFIAGSTSGTAFAPAVKTINGAALAATQQPYLLSITATGTSINWLDYPAFAGTATGVALDSQSQLYVSGTIVTAGNIDGTLLRFNAAATSASNIFVDVAGSGTDVLNGVAVNPSHLAFVVGTSNTPAGGLSTTSSNGPVLGTPNGLGPTPNTGTTNSAGAGSNNLAYAAVQYNDILVSPGTLTFTTAATSGTPATIPAQFISLSVISGAACFAAAPVPTVTGPFSATLQSGSTSVFSIVPTGAQTAPGPQTGTVSFASSTCPPGPENADNNNAPSATVKLTFNVTSTITAVPQNSLTLTEALNSATIVPNSVPGPNQFDNVTVNVQTATGNIPYTVAIATPSPNIAALGCTLFSTNIAGATTNGTGFSSFVISVSPFCAQGTPGVFTATVNVTGPGLNTVPIPLSLTVGGGVSAGGFNTNSSGSFVFTSNTAPSQSAVSTLTGTGTGSFTYATTYQSTAFFGATPVGAAPLPASAVTILAGASGTIPGGSTGSLTIQVSPTGLANGSYAGSILISPASGSSFNIQTLNVFVTVGGGLLALQPPASLTLSLPAGVAGLPVPTSVLPFSSIGVINGQPTSKPSLLINGPTGSVPSGVTVSSSLASIVTLTGGNCGPFSGGTCFFPISFTTPITPGTITGSITIAATAATGPASVTIPVNLTVTALPAFNGLANNPAPAAQTPLTGITLSAVVGQTLVCTANPGFGPPTPAGAVTTFQGNSEQLSPNVASTGATIGSVTITSAQPWIGNGSITAPGATTSIAGGGGTTVIICVTPTVLADATGVYQGSVVLSSASAGGPLTIPVTLLLNNTPGVIDLSNVGVFRALGGGGVFYENLNQTTYNYSASTTLINSFGLAGDQPIAGDWLGSGVVSIGVFRQGAFYFDLNNDGAFEPNEGPFYFGLPGDTAIVGDWTGSGSTKVGVFRTVGGGGVWYLSQVTLPAGATPGTTSLAVGTSLYNPATTFQYNFGLAGDQPVANNWSHTGNIDQIGVFRCNATACSWIVDNIGDGIFRTTDPVYPNFGIPGDIAVIGDWTDNNGPKRLGVFRPSQGKFYLDVDGSNTAATNDIQGSFGLPGDYPVIGKWTN